MSKNQMAIRVDRVDEHGQEVWWRVDRHGRGQQHRLGDLSRTLYPAARDAHEDWEPEVPFDVVTMLSRVLMPEHPNERPNVPSRLLNPFS
jgi:hypothetical protein